MAITPILDLDAIQASIISSINKAESNVIGDVIMLTFDDKNNASVVIENGKPKYAATVQEKIQMYLQVLIRTKLDKYAIYEGTGFGMTYFSFLGQKIPQSIILSEIKREVTEALQKISSFESITNFSTKQTGVSLSISFELNLNNETLSITI